MLCAGQTEGDIGYDERDWLDTEYDSVSGQFCSCLAFSMHRSLYAAMPAKLFEIVEC